MSENQDWHLDSADNNTGRQDMYKYVSYIEIISCSRGFIYRESDLNCHQHILTTNVATADRSTTPKKALQQPKAPKP